MMKKAAISVIVPCYKGEKYIAGCLENLLRQSYKNLEIIVVIDGDIDKSAEIAAGYPVKLIVLKKNRGLSAARNIGMANATGEYIHFMDVDDSINNDFYMNLEEAISATGADVACSGIINMRKAYKCQIFTRQNVYSTTKDKMKVTWVGKWGYVWRYLFRRSMLTENGLQFEEGRLIEDMPFSFKALYYADKIVTVPHTAYTYICNENSILTTRDIEWKKRCRKDLCHSKELIANFAKEHNFSVPGIGHNPGIITYIARKFYMNTAAAFGFRCF